MSEAPVVPINVGFTASKLPRPFDMGCRCTSLSYLTRGVPCISGITHGAWSTQGACTVDILPSNIRFPVAPSGFLTWKSRFLPIYYGFCQLTPFSSSRVRISPKNTRYLPVDHGFCQSTDLFFQSRTILFQNTRSLSVDSVSDRARFLSVDDMPPFCQVATESRSVRSTCHLSKLPICPDHIPFRYTVVTS